jgi:hypothetical protein
MCCCVWMGHVEQASFKPLGITIAVAKDRAIESLMQVGFNKRELDLLFYQLVDLNFLSHGQTSVTCGISWVAGW